MLHSVQMAAVTIKLTDDLAERLGNYAERLPEILELGLRELSADSQQGFEGTAEVLEFLASLPSPPEILTLRPSERFDRHVRELLEKSREGPLNPQEEEEWERYEFLEHLVRMAKTTACLKLGIVPGSRA
jgi:hypothetical protein